MREGFQRMQMTRRDTLRVAGAVGLVSASASACGLFATQPAEDSTPSGTSTGSEGTKASSAPKGREAPMLASQVDAGKLPPIEKRLPRDPLTITPTETVGAYGGQWRTMIRGPSDTGWLEQTIGYEPLVRWNQEWTEVVPNAAAEVGIEDGGSTFTISLREGMKWSDGTPFTADDIVFAVEDVYKSDQIYPVTPGYFSAGDGTVEVTKPDERTVRLHYPSPKGLLLQNLAVFGGNYLTALPKHYLKTFHKSYNANVDAMAKDNGYETWAELFLAKGGETARWTNPDLPTLDAWKVETPLTGSTRVVANRNPYYWKTDPDGSQLPYINRVVYDVIAEEDTMVLRVTSGDVDMHSRHIFTGPNKPVLARSRRKGGYHFFNTVTSQMNRMAISLNLTHPDRRLREIFQKKDFRVGLSHAIDRGEIINTVYQRQGDPWQVAPRPESQFHDATLAEQFTEFDVEKANAHLDLAGFRQRDDEGYRLRPDGDERISIAMEQAMLSGGGWPDALQLIKGYWKDVGVELRVRAEDTTLFRKRASANKAEASVWFGSAGGQDAILAPSLYFPFDIYSPFAVAWAQWYQSGGQEGERPPEGPRAQMELYDEILQTIDTERRRSRFMEILRITRDEFYAIGVVLPPAGYGVVKNDFKNVPSTMPHSSYYRDPGPTRPEQYFQSGPDGQPG